MSSVTIELPNSLHKKLEELAEKEGFSLEQFLTSAAAEKLSVMLQTEFLERESRLGTREGFEKVLAAVPDGEPENPDDRIKE
jgi:predicted transcriptional regulator